MLWLCTETTDQTYTSGVLLVSCPQLHSRSPPSMELTHIWHPVNAPWKIKLAEGRREGMFSDPLYTVWKNSIRNPGFANLSHHPTTQTHPNTTTTALHLGLSRTNSRWDGLRIPMVGKTLWRQIMKKIIKKQNEWTVNNVCIFNSSSIWAASEKVCGCLWSMGVFISCPTPHLLGTLLSFQIKF